MSDNKRLPRTRSPLQDIPFVYDSYRELTTQLGAVDGHAASLAIAARFFTDQSLVQPNEQTLGLSLAKNYGISTRFIDLNNLPVHLHQFLVVGTTKHWEDFLTRFRREQLALGREWRNRYDSEDKLSHALDCIDGAKETNIKRIGAERYALLQYYRLVRNATAHEIEKHERLRKEFEKVEKYRGLVLQEYGLDAPNPFMETKFDDHMLYTRVAKYVATDMCRLTPPGSLLELHKVLTDRLNFAHEPKFINQAKGDTPNLTKALRGFLNKNYNYRIDQNPILEQEVVAWINGIPNKKTRRDRKLGTVVDLLADEPVVDTGPSG